MTAADQNLILPTIGGGEAEYEFSAPFWGNLLITWAGPLPPLPAPECFT